MTKYKKCHTCPHKLQSRGTAVAASDEHQQAGQASQDVAPTATQYMYANFLADGGVWLGKKGIGCQ